MSRPYALELSRHQTFAAADLFVDLLSDDPITRHLNRKFLKIRGQADRVHITAPQRVHLLERILDHLTYCKDGCLLDQTAAEILAQLTTATERAALFYPDAEVLPGEIYRHHMHTAPDMIVRVERVFLSDRDPSPGSHGQCADVTVLAGGYVGTTTFALSQITIRAWNLQPLGF